ncbi:MAG: 1,4-dihydroxy-2-naphthoate octaprenyltransferase, partial [Acidimicrobiia bacterium]|nr:1,4-dihydroxy-2-naphthoate octaprenyltransferase [Acidimicrobiia bacterium]
RAAYLSFLIAALAGLGIAATTSWWLIAVGVASIVAAWTYTGGPSPYGYLGFGELFVFVFFGLVATVGSTYVIVESIPALAWQMGVAVGALACALLVTNNLRDIPTDQMVGKRTLAVRLGDARTRALYGSLVIGGVVVGVAAAWSRPSMLAVAIVLPLASRPVNVVRRGAKGPELIAVLGATGKVQMAFGLVATVALILGA